MQTYQHSFEKIEDYLHHRPPYLLLDRIVEVDDTSIVTEKKLTGDEFFFAGHFPGAAVLPGALMQEMTTQSAGALIAARYNPMAEFNTHDPYFNEFALGVLVKVKHARYRGFARPGDQLRIEVRLDERLGEVFEFVGRVYLTSDSEKPKLLTDNRFQLTNIPSKTIQDPA